jgi:hypothetical protein
LAYETYATGKSSYTEVVRLLNSKGYRTKQGKLFSTEMIRDMLQSRTYLGEIRYKGYRKKANGSRDVSTETLWLKGKYEAFITEELYNQCQVAREKAARHHLPTPKVHVYPLSGILYCGECQTKMRAQNWHGYRYYRCRARELGLDCGQKGIIAEELEQKVVDLVREMKPPADWKFPINQQLLVCLRSVCGEIPVDSKSSRKRNRNSPICLANSCAGSS